MVYVDSPRDNGWRLGPNAHLIADTDDELHAFAARLGLRRAWFQELGRGASINHYDLTVGRWEKALTLGAVGLGRREFIAKVRELRPAQREALAASTSRQR